MEQLGTVDLTAEEKMKYVENEVLRVWRGESSIMACPYCFALNVKPEEPEKAEALCCRLFAYAAMAAMSGQEVQELMDKAARIADKVHG